MKKILGIVSSARRLGNCEIMVKEIARNISGPCALKLLRLTDFDIRPCRGCYACLFKEEKCVIDDDLYKILEPLAEADALILAVPAYFLSTHSFLKRFLDRGLSFYTFLDRLWGKPSVGVAIAGIEGKEGSTLLGVENFLKMTLSRIKQTTVVYGALPGEIFLNTKNRDIAKDMAAALFGDPVPKKGPSCPLCGGDTFRFLGKNSVRCMLCSNEGEAAATEGVFRFSIEKSDHQLFLSRQEAADHKKWLVGMKSRFMEKRKALKQITVGYRKDGEWIVP